MKFNADQNFKCAVTKDAMFDSELRRSHFFVTWPSLDENDVKSRMGHVVSNEGSFTQEKKVCTSCWQIQVVM